ncbi:MAG: alkaline phosphatase [Phocaeicola sp.]
MRKISFIFSFILLSTLFVQGQVAKYVFYFIGDGMGVNQIMATEMYDAELQGEIGINPLCFTQFPYESTATTYSTANSITDSSAAGTALATGVKTKNGALAVEADLVTPISSIATWAQQKGSRVGIGTSVSIDHATPAAFYAHQGSRKNYYPIGLDLITANFDFYAGSDFLDPTNKKSKSGDSRSLYELSKEAGYTITRSYKEYQKQAKKSKKMILFQPESATDKSAIPYAIDRQKGDLSLEDITRAGINFLSKDKSKGFFLMIEGGKIDWACHANDAATTIREIIDFDNSIKIAYEFYQQHPDETLIVVTADHETGGLVLGKGPYTLNLKALKHQKASENEFTKNIAALRKKHKNEIVPWEAVKQALKESFGFWGSIELSKEQEDRLKNIYTQTFEEQSTEVHQSEYQKAELIASEARDIMSDIAHLGWGSQGHSAGYVPIYAIGVGAELFQGRMDNIDIPVHIGKAAGYID